MTNYVIYIGDVVQDSSTSLGEAERIYNSLPSGQGKRPGLRRSLVQEITILSDKR
jgi:hypothetical protein